MTKEGKKYKYWQDNQYISEGEEITHPFCYVDIYDVEQLSLVSSNILCSMVTCCNGYCRSRVLDPKPNAIEIWLLTKWKVRTMSMNSWLEWTASTIYRIFNIVRWCLTRKYSLRDAHGLLPAFFLSYCLHHFQDYDSVFLKWSIFQYNKSR